MEKRFAPRAGALVVPAAVLAAALLSVVQRSGRAQDPTPRAPVALPTTGPEAPRPGGAPVNVPVKIVSLYSSGVGYFEHFGHVRGGSHTELKFDTDDINDVLKTLVVQDVGGGRVARITYPTEEPVAQALEGFELNLAGNFSLPGLLGQLRGEPVTLSLGAEEVTGKVLGVDQRHKPVEGKGSVEVWVLSVASKGQIRSFELQEVRAIQVKDPELQQELDEALDVLARAKDREVKPVTLHFEGKQGDSHNVRIGYVTETPIWKTSYRLVIPGEEKKQGDKQGEGEGQKDPKGAGQSRLQGWAIVTNQTDNDWENVQLSLVSGRPLSFRQDLAQPLYVPRPLVEPELYANLKPPQYAAGVEPDLKPGAPAAVEAERMRTASEARRAAAAPAAAARRLNAAARDQAGGQGQLAAGKDQQAWLKQAIDPSASVGAAASTADLGELFQYTLGSVTLARHQSAMVPIVSDPVKVERLSVYDHSVLPDHPLNGARLTNTTGKHLLHGPVAVYEGSAYSGDARIENLPPGQDRLISYGIDLQVLVNSTHTKTYDTITSAKIVGGVLHLTRRHVFEQQYVIQNKADYPKAVLVNHPFRQGWKLAEPEKPLETTGRYYRFSVDVPANDKQTLTVKEQKVDGQAVALLPIDAGQILAYARTGEISPEVRQALQKAAELKQALTATERQIQQRQAEINEIGQAQARIRENMRAVDRNTEYYNRLVKKLDEQETRIETIRSEIEQLQKQRDERRSELEAYLGGLEVGQGPNAAAATEVKQPKAGDRP